MGDWLLRAALWCVTVGWLPALFGEWLLLALAPVCFVSGTLAILYGGEPHDEVP